MLGLPLIEAMFHWDEGEALPEVEFKEQETGQEIWPNVTRRSHDVTGAVNV